MGAGGVSKSQVIRLCAETDERVKDFLSSPRGWPENGCWPTKLRGFLPVPADAHGRPLRPATAAG
jgi:hypothetical protein